MFSTIKSMLSNFHYGVISFGFKDISSNQDFYFNENQIFPAASIIKIPVLVEFFRQVENNILNPKEKISLSKKDIVRGAGILFELHEGIEVTLLDLAVLMIVISDNSATNILLSILGFDKVNSLMKEGGMSSSYLRRKMMALDYKPEEENIITTKDMIVFMEKLLNGELLSPLYTKEAVDILKRQQYNEKIPLYLPYETEVAHKTGEFKGVRNDVGALYINNNIYLLSFLTREVTDNVKTDLFIAEVSKIIYNSLSPHPPAPSPIRS